MGLGDDGLVGTLCVGEAGLVGEGNVGPAVSPGAFGTPDEGDNTGLDTEPTVGELPVEPVEVDER